MTHHPHTLRLLSSTTALLVGCLALTAGSASATPSAAALKADYRLQDVRTSTAGSSPALQDVGGKNAFTTQSVDGTARRVLAFPDNSGVQVRPAAAVPTGSYTLALLVKFKTVSGYVRVADVKHGTSDTGLYVYNGYLNFFNLLSGPRPAVKPDVWTQVVLTRDAGSRKVVGYVNGVQQLSFTDTAGLAVIDSTRTLTFFRDNTSDGSTGEASPGAVARIRLWSGPLTPTQVKALDRLPG